MFEPTAEFFERIPTSPGVYLMKDRAGTVIYVGKAINLRNRLRQYFRPGDDNRYFVAAGLLGRSLADVETVVVDNEKEALLLENHLIKQHQPRFNVKLRDDKQYLVLRIDPRDRFPRLQAVRNIKDDGAQYFGPYHSATSCRQTLRTVNRYFQLRTCTDHVLNTRTRPCLQYQIRRCPGPCVFPIDESDYGDQVEDVMMFLGGKKDELLPRLRARMKQRADTEQFESAAQIRDSIYAVESSLARQNIVQDVFVDQDVFGMVREATTVEVVVLFIRAGKLVGRRSFRQRDQEFPDAHVLSSFVQQYYATGTFVPDEVIVPLDLENPTVLADWLSSQRGRKVKVIAAKRGKRTKLLALAAKNAAASAASRARSEEDSLEALGKLSRRLSLKRIPRRIECFDIAHIQGAETVASRVVFVDGLPDSSQYRKFKVKTVTNDDFGAMYEVITRRFRRSTQSPDPAWEHPDLLIVDGGKGQLSTALAALSDLGIEITADKGFDVVGLAKERETETAGDQPDRVYLRNVKDPIRLRQNTAELFLLSRVRDEAHRFANAFHRQRRKKATLRSRLDDVPGIGPVRRKQLLRHFGSLKAVREASEEQLLAVPGMNRRAAAAIRAHFAGGQPVSGGQESA